MKNWKYIFALVAIVLWMGMKTVEAQMLSAEKVHQLIQNNAPQTGITLKDIANPASYSAHWDESSGIQYIYVQQYYKGIKILNAIKTLGFKNGVFAYGSGSFLKGLALKTNSETPSIGAENAIRAAAAHLQLATPTNLTETSNTFDSNHKITFSDGGISREGITAELMWVSIDEGKTLQLAWNVIIDDKTSSNWWNVRIDAQKGSYINQINHTLYCEFGGKEHGEGQHKPEAIQKPFQDKSTKAVLGKAVMPNMVTNATYSVIPYPADNINVSPFTTVTNPWTLSGNNNNATTYGWHYDGTNNYTYTRGNNVFAYDDSLGINAPGRADTSVTSLPNLAFTSVYNTAVDPTTRANRKAATTNLFYWNNILHDMTYQYGFTEAAGNYQQDNMGRGGQGNDYVKAEAQDGSGINNANFAGPADGYNGRMQMYLWTTTGSVRGDGDIDNGIMSHEFMHGVSLRLTGGVVGMGGCLGNNEQGGEGWSDYNSLMLTTNWATANLSDGGLARPVGTYVYGQSINGNGLRTFPYSTNMSINPHTYADISSSAHFGEVHYIGEIWCSVLWDMTWSIINQVGSISSNLFDANGTGGNVIAYKLVMQGLKLQPCAPGFIDARNAILAADSIIYGGAHTCAIWSAFARRGMGWSASQGSTFSVYDQTVAYDVPSSVLLGRTPNFYSSISNQPVTITINAKCGCSFPVNNYTIVDTIPPGFSYISSSGGTVKGNVVKFRGVSFTKALQTKTFTINLLPTGVGCSVDSVINDDRDTNLDGGFTSTVANPVTVWQPSNEYANNGNYSWHANEDTTSNDVSLVSKQVNLKPFSIFSFYQLHETENQVDGGFVEYSTDSGITWKDGEKLFIRNGYNNNMDASCPSAGRNGFTGGITNAFQQSWMDFSSLNGQKVMVRFRFITDHGNLTNDSLPGWYVDDIVMASGCGGMMQTELLDSNNTSIDAVKTPLFINPSVLAAQKLDFQATKKGETVLLTWKASESSKNERYWIERSADGISWKVLDTVDGANSGAKQDYSLIDGTPTEGINYYRLKIVDENGRISYSIVQKVVFGGLSKGLIIHPNPASEKVWLSFDKKWTKGTVSMMDLLGKRWMNTDFTNNNKGMLEINIQPLPKGIYFVTISSSSGQILKAPLVVDRK